MDTSEKIIVFDSFERLTQVIIRDQDTRDMLSQRYAVRFIMLNNFNAFKDLAKFMANIGVDTLDMENLIDEGEDVVDIAVGKGTGLHIGADTAAVGHGDIGLQEDVSLFPRHLLFLIVALDAFLLGLCD